MRYATWWIVLGLGLPLGLSLGAAQAAEYFVDPDVRLSGEYDSNPRQNPTNEQDAYGGVLDAALGFGVRSPVSLISLEPRIQTYRFDDSTVNRSDKLLTAALQRDFSNEFKAHLDANYSSVSLLNDPQNDVTASTSRNRKSWTATPLLSWQVGARDALEAELSYTDTMYEGEASGFADYDYRIGTLRWKRQWTSATIGSVEPYASEFRNLDDGSRSRDLGGRLGLETELSPTLKLIGAIGYVHSKFDCDTVQNPGADPVCVFGAATDHVTRSSDNILGSFELQKRFSSTSSVRAGYERSAGGSGRGVRTVRDKLSFGLDQDFSERLRFSASALYQRSNLDIGANSTGLTDSDIARALVELRYAVAQAWYIGAGYRYRYRKDDRTTDPAAAAGSSRVSESHNPFVFISYEGKPYTVLR